MEKALRGEASRHANRHVTVLRSGKVVKKTSPIKNVYSIEKLLSTRRRLTDPNPFFDYRTRCVFVRTCVCGVCIFFYPSLRQIVSPYGKKGHFLAEGTVRLLSTASVEKQWKAVSTLYREFKQMFPAELPMLTATGECS